MALDNKKTFGIDREGVPMKRECQEKTKVRKDKKCNISKGHKQTKKDKLHWKGKKNICIPDQQNSKTMKFG